MASAASTSATPPPPSLHPQQKQPEQYPSKTRISSAHMKAAKQAVAPSATSAAGQGAGLVGQALKTPSWTSIVEAYHKDGGGDREMLLALLHAKAKEDERLASLDMLRAEQLRAYSAHLAMHAPMYQQPPHHASHPHAHPAATAAAFAAQTAAYYGYASHAAQPYPHHAPPQPKQQAPRQAKAGPSTMSAPKTDGDRAPSSSTAGRTSRSPSLTRSATSRQSSVDVESVKTPSEEKSHALPRTTSTSPRTQDYSSFPAPPPAASETLPPLNMKRKRPVGGIREENEDNDEDDEDNGARRARFVRRTTPPGAVNSRRTSPKDITSPRSLKHILNDDLLRPLGSTRVATSDVRSSSSSGEE